MADFFSGVANTADGGSASILVGNLVRHFTYSGYAAFFQDDWRVSPRLILNLGLRYELDTVPVEQDNLQGNFTPASGLQQVGKGISAPYQVDHNNFSPRLGFAWDIFGNGKTVLRGGGGVLYEQLSLDVFQGIGNSFGLRVEPTGNQLCSGGATGSCVAGPGNIAVANVSLSGTPLDGATPPPGSFATAAPGSVAFGWGNNSQSTPIFPFVTACGEGNTVIPGSAGLKPSQCHAIMVNQNLRSPYVEVWNLSLQRSLSNNLSLEVSYVGNHGVKLIGALDLNQPTLSTINVPGVGSVTTGPGWTPASLSACAAGATLKALKATCAPSGGLENAGRPFHANFPYLRFVDYFGNLDTSSYNGLQATLTARNYHGLTMTTGYTYSHALGESSDQGTSGGLVIPANSYGNFRNELYTSTAFDMYQRLTISGNYAIPGKKGFGQMLEGWAVNSAAVIQTGTPWGVNDTTTDFAGIGEANGRNPQANEGMQWNFLNSQGGPGYPSDFEAIHNFSGVTPGPTKVTGVPFFPGTGNTSAPTVNASCNSAAGSNPLAKASLAVLGCYALGNSVLIPLAYGSFGAMPRNPFRDQGFRNWDLSVSKSFKFKERLSAQLRVEFFNVLNHPNFVNPFGGPGLAGTSNDINPSRAGAGTRYGYVLNTPRRRQLEPRARNRRSARYSDRAEVDVLAFFLTQFEQNTGPDSHPAPLPQRVSSSAGLVGHGFRHDETRALAHPAYFLA